MLINSDFGKAKALVFLINKYFKNKSINIEKTFNNIAQDKDEYDIRYIDFDYQEFLKLDKLYLEDSVISKIYFLKECTYCSLNRAENPQVREFIENSIVNFITKNYSIDQNIIITDLASGYLLQTFVTLNKIVSLGFKNIRLNLIDNLYKNIYLDKELIFNKQDEFYIIKNIKEASTKNNFQLTDKFASLIDKLVINQAIKQFINWFKNLNINLSLNIFSNTQEYTKTNNQKIDILLAIDYPIELYPELYIEWNQLTQDNLSSNSYACSLSKKAYKNTEQVLLSIGNSKHIEHFDWNKSLNKFTKSS